MEKSYEEALALKLHGRNFQYFVKVDEIIPVKSEQEEDKECSRKKAEIKNQPKDMLKKIPDKDRKILDRILNKNVVLAGGSLISCLIDKPINDYDIFFIGSGSNEKENIEECKQNARRVSKIIYDALTEIVPFDSDEDYDPDSYDESDDCLSEEECSPSDESDDNVKDKVIEERSPGECSSDESTDYSSDEMQEDPYFPYKAQDYGRKFGKNPPIVFRSPSILQIGKFQLILKAFDSMKNLMCNFDLSCCEILYDGRNVYFSRMALFSYRYGVVPITKQSIIPKNDFSRIYKYYDKGFDFCFPHKFGYEAIKIQKKYKKNKTKTYIIVKKGNVCENIKKESWHKVLAWSKKISDKQWKFEVLEYSNNDYYTKGGSMDYLMSFHEYPYEMVLHTVCEFVKNGNNGAFAMPLEGKRRMDTDPMDMRFDQEAFEKYKEMIPKFKKRMFKDNRKSGQSVEYQRLKRPKIYFNSYWCKLNIEEFAHMAKFYVDKYNNACERSFHDEIDYIGKYQSKLKKKFKCCSMIVFDMVFYRTSNNLFSCLPVEMWLLVRNHCCDCKSDHK